MRTKTPHLLIAIDFGASATKAVGSVEDNPDCEAILMTPHCIKVEDDTLPNNPEFDENSTWVKLGDELYIVGKWAAIRYSESIRVRPNKVTTALPKIWAVVGLFAQKFKLPAKFKVSIIFVLPPAEWAQRVIIEEKLTSVETIQTPRGTIEPKLIGISSAPEGLGILQSQGWAKAPGVSIIVMLGFRNASSIASDYGKVDRPQTSDLGFHHLLKSIASKTGYKIEEMIEPVFNHRQAQLTLAQASQDLASHKYKMDRADYNTPTRQKYEGLIEQDKQRIATSKLTLQNGFDRFLRCAGKDRDTERAIAIKAVESSTANYFELLTDWLDEMLPTQSERICLCGGTANYLGTELDSFFLGKLKSRAKENLFRHSPLSINTLQRQIDVDRFADIYAHWHRLTELATVTK
jgi:hypothetical protein